MDDLMLPLPGLSPVGGKVVVARFDGGCLSSDAGVLVLRGIEQRLGVAERLAGCIDDPRAQAQVLHGLAEMIRFRMLMIASGYEDGNDATASCKVTKQNPPPRSPRWPLAEARKRRGAARLARSIKRAQFRTSHCGSACSE